MRKCWQGKCEEFPCEKFTKGFTWGILLYNGLRKNFMENFMEKFMEKKFFFLSFFAFFSAFLCVSCKSVEPSALEAEKKLEEQEKFAAFTQKEYKSISLGEFSDGFSHARYVYKDSIPPYPLYKETMIAGIAENMVYLQNPDGGWAKNQDYQRIFTLEKLKERQENNKKIKPVTYNLLTESKGSTMDNRNIFSQIRYLAQVYQQIPEKRYGDCALKALQWILNAQEPVTGGFTGADVYAITFNDDVISDVLTFLGEVVEDKKLYSFVDEDMRAKAKKAWEHGLECILKTQITLTLKDGSKILSAWCQQHSYENYAPIWAREFEPPAVSSLESRKIVIFLMSLKNPSEEVKNAVVAACTFFDRPDIRIKGKRLVRNPRKAEVLGGRYYDYEQVLIDDPSARDCWARFYALDSSFDVETGARKPIQGFYPSVLSPIWCDRGCKYVENFNDLSVERRNGYGYTNTSMEKLVSVDFPAWKKRLGL